MRFLTLMLAATSLSGAAFAQDAADAVAPEGASSGDLAAISPEVAAALEAKAAGQPVEAQEWIVAAANPHAVGAGADVLRAGGTAADAMVAVQTVLGLVEPQSSGLGGGAFLVWHDGETGEITTLDGREKAPLAATPQLFQNDAGEPLGFFDAVVGGRSVGVPGTPMLMYRAHEKWGTAEWSSLFDAATTLAEDGFAVSPRLASLVAEDTEYLGRFDSTAAYFLPDGQPLAEGSQLSNPDYANVLKRLAEEGPDAFYTGEIAQGIVDTVKAVEGNAGVMEMMDLALYDVVERDAVCADFRGFEVCGMGPPSSGALTVGQILGMMNALEPGTAEDADTWRVIGDASRLAFADRGRYMADSDFVPMPTAGLVDPGYLTGRAELLKTDKALTEVSPGEPEWDHAQLWADDQSIEFPSTSHISIVDQYGNALSMTTTIENGFGSRLMTDGFLLNNELTDFSFQSHSAGVPIANRVEPGKRPRSSMAPTIVRQDGAPVLVIGSPGGSRIIGYVAQAIVAHVDWGMDVQQAVAMPHAVNRFGTYDLEEGTPMAEMQGALEEMGFEVSVRDLTSGLHAISIGEDGLKGGADPRREGIALGE
ncbi:gamma-glutamyltransferase [Ponticoccus alexandrii]|uniref:Glutathione hydrolase proenzyme n=1 Tax=Ponticoccus alexandrii TaxID=1943633 RepID=A0ABX7FC24_9RHOB|nr:gamma-glutamyltransferase [Ponticoccus alexandrii]ETA51989.2 gamma-glutamyltransferase [Rhodobacteraceae bacterium PD-2]QRF68120.1 gamma-glutamyltransferase [Ponticoccus alexandrii]